MILYTVIVIVEQFFFFKLEVPYICEVLQFVVAELYMRMP